MRTGVACLALLALLAVGSAAAKAASPVVVLKGGEVIALKEPYTIKGSNAILIRTDGTMFSVPVSEIDQKATKARMSAPRSEAAPAAVSAEAETPAEAARAAGTRPRARVRLTDADVGHQPTPEGEEGSDAGAAAAGPGSSSATPAKVEVADYTQDKAGSQFVVRGNLRNIGASTASGVRMTVFLVNEKGESFTRREAGLATTTIEAGHTISFSAAFDTGAQNVNGVRFQPIWVAAPLPSPAGGAGGGAAGASNGSSAMRGAPPAPSPAAAPQPVPTPYGRGLLWAPGAPPASDKPPADGTNGYIPGAARPEDQPKPPQ